MASLYKCIENGGTAAEVYSLIQSGADINYRDENGWTILHEFCSGYRNTIGADSFKILHTLLEHGADVNAISTLDGTTTSMYLVSSGFPVNHLELVISKAADINSKNDGGNSVLHCFAQGYHRKKGVESLEVLKYLAERSASIDDPNEENETPLMRLLLYGYPLSHLVKLLEKGADVSRRSYSGDCALNMFVEGFKSDFGEESLNVLQFLVDRVTELNCVGSDGRTPLFKLLEYRYPLDYVRILLDKGAHINHTDRWGDTVIHKFVYNYKSDPGGESLMVLKFLLERGAKMDHSNYRGETPLMKLLEYRYPLDHLIIFLNEGANVNNKNCLGDSVLHKFIKAYKTDPDATSLKVLKLLLEKGMVVDCWNVGGETPVMKLLEYGYPFNHFTIIWDVCTDINHRDELGDSVLHKYATGYKSNTGPDSLQVLKSLVQRAVSLDCANNKGETPVMKLLEYGYPFDQFIIILSKCTEIIQTDKLGDSVLHKFATGYKSDPSTGSLTVLKSLVEKVTHFDLTNKQDKTPVMKFLEYGYPFDHLIVLLEKGVNVNYRDEAGDGILHLFAYGYRSNPGAESLKVLQSLVERIASLDCSNNEYESPVMRLLVYGYPLNHIKIFFEKGVSVDRRDMSGNSILHLFPSGYKSNPGVESLNVLKFLLRTVTNVDCLNDKCVTPFMLLLEYGYPLDHVIVMFENGVDINRRNELGNSVIHLFAYGYQSNPGAESVKVLEYLMQRGASLDCVNNDHLTPVLMLVKNRFPADHLRVILDRGVDIARCSTVDYTLLDHLFMVSDTPIDILQMLLEYGAQPKVHTFYFSYGYYNFTKNRIDCIKMLCNFGAKPYWGRFCDETVYNYVHHSTEEEDFLYETLYKCALLSDRTTFDYYNERKIMTFINAALAELAKLETRYLTDRLTVYDFLVETNCKKLGAYLRSDNFDFFDPEEDFPIYAELIRSKMGIGSRWATVLDKLDGVSLSSRTDIEVVLDHDCILHIAKFLDQYHLAKFVSASELPAS